MRIPLFAICMFGLVYLLSFPAIADDDESWPNEAQPFEKVVQADELALRNEAVCAVLGEEPQSFWRDAYLSRDRNSRCTTSALLVQDLECKVSGSLEGAAAGSAIVQSVIMSYVSDCLTPLSNVTDPNGGYNAQSGYAKRPSKILINMTSQDEVEVLKRSIGVLSKPDGVPYCSASVVDAGDGRIGILTALHCLGRTVTTVEGEKINTAYDYLSFSPISGETLRIRLDRGHDGLVFQTPRDDVVMIPITDSGRIGVLPLKSRALAAYEPIMIVGANPFLFGRPLGEDAHNLSRWLESFSVSFEAACRVDARSQDGSLSYGSQTATGTSGGPILLVEDGRFVVAGVHTGSNAEAYEPADGQRCVKNESIRSSCPGGTKSMNRGIEIVALKTAE